jgi:hypothetical protein
LLLFSISENADFNHSSEGSAIDFTFYKSGSFNYTHDEFTLWDSSEGLLSLKKEESYDYYKIYMFD